MRAPTSSLRDPPSPVLQIPVDTKLELSTISQATHRMSTYAHPDFPICTMGRGHEYNTNVAEKDATLLTAVNRRDSHKDSSSAAEGSNEVGDYRESTEDCSAKGSSRWNNSLELLVHAAFTVSRHHLSISQNTAQTRSRGIRLSYIPSAAP